MRVLECLDLYCGLGGWSKGFAAEGFNCTGIDIVNVGYPYQLILQDIRSFDGTRCRGKFDVIVGSPPCRDFSRMCTVATARKWRDPPDPLRGLELVDAFQCVVHEAQPRFWLMENVPGLKPYLGMEPECIVYLSDSMRRAFWGWFPPFIVPQVNKRLDQINTKLRAWKRAEIPLPVARAFARAVKEELLS